MFGDAKRMRTLEATTAALVTENDTLRVKVATIQAENRHLRRRLPQPDTLKVLRRARLDAELLIASHLAGLPTSRRESVNLGISHRRWNYATALLALARVRDRAGGWRTDDPAQLRQRLEYATAHVESKGVTVLLSHAAKWGYSGRRKRP